MNYRYKNLSGYLISLPMIICLVLASIGCGPSQEAKKADQLKELMEKERINIFNKWSDLYGAVNFPTASLTKYGTYTYDFQEYISANQYKNFIFRASLIDIRRSNDVIIADFNIYKDDDKSIIFPVNNIIIRLELAQDKVSYFLKRRKHDKLSRMIDILYYPEYYIVAKIHRVKWYHPYGTDGGDSERGVELDLKSPPNLVLKGSFIDAHATKSAIKADLPDLVFQNQHSAAPVDRRPGPGPDEAGFARAQESYDDNQLH